MSGSERLEVKSSSTRQRMHYFSQIQLTPPSTARLMVASLFVERVGGGISLGRLFEELRNLFAADARLLSRFDKVFYATLGAGWADALEECFDAELAQESLQFYDARNIPRIDEPLPSGIADVRFSSDLSVSTPLLLGDFASRGALFAAFVPVSASRN